MSVQRDVHLVIGGGGFVGRHIVEQLVQRGESVAVFSRVQRHYDVPFYSGDINDESQISQAIQKSGATCVFHTASPHAGSSDAATCWKVNVEGTKAIISACVANGIKKLVYTSSSTVVFNGQDLIDVDERCPPPEVAMDHYNETKLRAEELVLAANGKDGLYTVSLRPAGIFGPGDNQLIPGYAEAFKEGKAHYQIGDNTNLFDFTYVGNVAYAHILAAQKLIPPPIAPDEDKVDEIINRSLPSIDATTGKHRIPTSDARPLGPYVDPPPNADALLAAFNDTSYVESRPVARTRYDQFSKQALERSELPPLQVAGQAFFITNGEPVYFWDFSRALWREMALGKYPTKGFTVLPRTVGLTFATMVEWWGWLTGTEPVFTRYRVTYSCSNMYYNIEKARRLLGYEPQVGLEEGIKLSMEWWRTVEAKNKSS